MIDKASRTDLSRIPLIHTPDIHRELCPYCGAPLSPDFYFCCACAAPYKSIDAVVAPARPMPLSDGQLIRRKAPHVATLFWSYVGTVLFAAIAAELLFQEDRPDLKLLLQVTSVLVTTCVFAAAFWTSLRVQFRQLGFTRSAAYVGLALLAPMLLLNFAYSRLLMKLLPDADGLPLAALREAGISEAALIILFCLYPAIAEEIGFRGLLQHWLQVAIRPDRAILLASALFAAVHFSILSFPYLFALGALLGWTKWKTASLYPSMLMHFLHNLVVLQFM